MASRSKTICAEDLMVSAYKAVRSAVAVLLALLMVQSATPQGVPLDQHAEVIRAEVVRIGQGGKATIEMLDGRKYHGKISAIGTEDVTLDEVSVKQKETIRYKKIQRIRKGYEHKSQNTHWVAIVIGAGVFFGLIIAAAVELGKS